MSVTLTFHGHGCEPFDVDLDDETYARVDAYRAARGLTLDQLFEVLIRDFLATHPILAQTRTPQ